MMRRNKLFILLVILLFIGLFFVTTFLILNQTNQVNNSVDYSFHENTQFNYNYNLPKGYLIQEQLTDIGHDGIVYGELIYKDIVRKVQYEKGGINIYVYDISVLKDKNLQSWIESKTSNTSNDISARFVSSFIKSLRGNYIYLIDDSNPLLGGTPSPVLFIKGSDFIYEISQFSLGNDYSLFKSIINSIEVSKDKIKLTQSELNIINSYFK